MMAYASPVNMLRYFGAKELAQICAPANAEVTGDVMEQIIETGTADSTVFDAASDALQKLRESLDNASVLIDSYLAARYDTPAINSYTVDVLRRPCADLARCDLFVHGKPEDVAKTCETVKEWLRDIAKGVITLPFADNLDEANPVSTRPLLRVN